MTKSNSPSLSKICSACGIEKPLAAFLQFSGTGGATYGSICYTCRKANRDKKNVVEDTTGRSGTGYKYKIDANARLQSETDKLHQREHIEEEYHEEREEKEVVTQTVVDKKADKQEKERHHRETHLNKPAQLDSKKVADVKAANKQFFASEAAKTKIDYAAGPVLDTQIAGKLKYQSSIYNTFKSWLGGSAPIVQNTNKLATSNSVKPATPTVEQPHPTPNPTSTSGPGKKR